MGCSQNLNDIKSDFLLEQMGNTQYTYWSCIIEKQNFKHNSLKEVIRTSYKNSPSTPSKSWKSKRSEVKIVTGD